MTIGGALSELNNFLKADDIPFYYRPSIKAVIDTITLEQEPKMGYWISLDTGNPSHLKDGMTTESVKCSECGEWLTASDEYTCNGNYCPHCGCRMESEE